ncbi:uncharacterized protein LOC116774779 isoform X1 [Danaus plexippus]|uniref:uncharacterized protein LOC116774779 isoform X1 n=2 Tax=Danaus plexippus TaxID=13037 RepID=UPI002AB0B032|nr:uncharacterized protein LOC116774779 isoform X1 [Danaus plexippus]
MNYININIYTICVTFLVQFQYTSAQEAMPDGGEAMPGGGEAIPDGGFNLNKTANMKNPQILGPAGNAAEAEKQKFTIPTTTPKKRLYTTEKRVSFAENCDYLAHFCLKAYDTGSLCGRTLYFSYYTFKNYCLLDYTNCMERYEVWQVAYMGNCSTVKLLTEYLVYPYDNDLFLDEYIIEEEK